MAYRATKKSGSKAVQSSKASTVVPEASGTEPTLESVIEPVTESKPSVSSGNVSIEDLIGAPQSRDIASSPRKAAEKPITQTAISPVVSVPQAPIASVLPSQSYQPQAQPQPVPYRDQPVPYRSGGYRQQYNNPNRQRRDFSGSQDRGSGGNFTPDINVPTETVKGILDTMPEGHGFLRPKFTPSDRDVYISQSQIRRFLLRNGDMVEGQARQPKENERYWGLLKVEKIDDKPAEEMVARAKFEDLIPVYPNKQLILETQQFPLSTRMIDLVAPIGFGQRGLLVSPPKAGKTTILKEIAAGVSANYPDVHLMAALIGERPEEVTDITRSVKGEVLASNFDESPSEQVRIAEVALDRAKRLVEMGKDVVILLDSITRLARAYNLVVNPSGRTLSGGFDPAALYPAKRFLGAARCVEKSEGNINAGGGSLTVIGTALVDTGSRMDDLIYEEFKGTGNMELHLSRSLQERRIFPAIDAEKSGTRHDELLLGEEAMKKVTTLRHMLSLLSAEERTMMLIERLNKTKSNAEFLESLSKG